jgi:hypothetical protein
MKTPTKTKTPQPSNNVNKTKPVRFGPQDIIAFLRVLPNLRSGQLSESDARGFEIFLWAMNQVTEPWTDQVMADYRKHLKAGRTTEAAAVINQWITIIQSCASMADSNRVEGDFPF